jgi:pilus assembly protein CpaE
MNAPWKSAAAGARDPFMAYVCDDLTLDVIRTVCDDMGWPQEKAFKGGLRNAVQSLSVSASPQILLVDLSESGDPISDINGLAEVCEPGTVVIAMGQVNDVRLYRDLMMSGLQDYLLKPVSPDALRDAVTHAQMILNAPKHEEGAREHTHLSTAIIGTRGGVGASTIATSVAWLLSERMGHLTGMLDLDVHFGTGALALDLEPGRGLTDAIDNPSRIDGLFIERAMIKANDKLSILSAEAPISSPILTDGSAFFQLQEEFRVAFENSIIDLPRSMLIAYPHLLQDVNVVVVVHAAGGHTGCREAALFVEHVAPAHLATVGDEYANQVVSLRLLRGDAGVAIDVQRQPGGVLVQVARTAGRFERCDTGLQAAACASGQHFDQ